MLGVWSESSLTRDPTILLLFLVVYSCLDILHESYVWLLYWNHRLQKRKAGKCPLRSRRMQEAAPNCSCMNCHCMLLKWLSVKRLCEVKIPTVERRQFLQLLCWANRSALSKEREEALRSLRRTRSSQSQHRDFVHNGTTAQTVWDFSSHRKFDLRLCTATAAARQAQHDQLENSSVFEINETQLLFKKLILISPFIVL